MNPSQECSKYLTKEVPPNPDDTKEQYAERLFLMYMECLSANAGTDLYPQGGFFSLDEETKDGWIMRASKAMGRE